MPGASSSDDIPVGMDWCSQGAMLVLGSNSSSNDRGNIIMSIQIEIIDEVLDYPTIENINCKAGEGELFNRNRVFAVGGSNYHIVWYANVSYLHTSCGVIIPFTNVIRSNTWPNKSKMNLQFYNEDSICCILKIDDYRVCSDCKDRLVECSQCKSDEYSLTRDRNKGWL